MLIRLHTKGLKKRSLAKALKICFRVMALVFLAQVTLNAQDVQAEPTELPSSEGQAPLQSPNKRASYVPSTTELAKKLQLAVARVTIKLHGVPIAQGSGFFASKSGLFITSRSLMRHVLASSPASSSNSSIVTAEFSTSDRKTIKDYRVVHCELLKGGDLCALKLAHEPKVILSLRDALPEAGSGANVLGYPRGLDFSITPGNVVKVSASSGQVEVAVALAPGNAGAPVVDDQGRLLGAVARPGENKFDVHALAPATDILRFLDWNETPLTLNEAKKLAQSGLRADLRARAVGELDPALVFAGRAKSLEGLKGFKEVALKFDNRLMRLNVPDVFDDCEFTQKSRESTLYACHAFGDAAILSIQRFPSKGYEDLSARNGKRLLEPKMLSAVEGLIRDEQWDLYEPLLMPTQKKIFQSDPLAAQCQVTKPSLYKGAAFSETPACRFAVMNDTDLGGYSINVWLLTDQHLFAVAMWVNSSSLAEYFARIPILAILTARWDQPTKPDQPSARILASELASKPLPTYRVELPETVSFRGARIEANGTQLDLYGKKLLLDRFEDGFTVVVTNQKKAYLAPDFDDVTRSSSVRIARILGTHVQNKTMEVEPINVAGKPARLLTAFGRDQHNREVLILTGTVFFDDEMFELTQVSASKDPTAAFKEFKTLLSGFKRK